MNPPAPPQPDTLERILEAASAFQRSRLIRADQRAEGSSGPGA